MHDLEYCRSRSRSVIWCGATRTPSYETPLLYIVHYWPLTFVLCNTWSYTGRRSPRPSWAVYRQDQNFTLIWVWVWEQNGWFRALSWLLTYCTIMSCAIEFAPRSWIPFLLSLNCHTSVLEPPGSIQWHLQYVHVNYQRCAVSGIYGKMATEFQWNFGLISSDFNRN